MLYNCGGYVLKDKEESEEVTITCDSFSVDKVQI